MTGRITIESLSVRGFRNINHELVFNFDNPAIHIFGDVGVGKSSILGAIEWCLFGELAYVQYKETKEQEDIVNELSEDNIAIVKLVLNVDKKGCAITRQKRRGASKSKLLLEFDGCTFADAEGMERLSRIIGLTLDDFCRAIYLHQESIRAILAGERKERDETLDRLFGIDELRSIASSISLNDVEETVETLNKKKTKIDERISVALPYAEKHLKAALRDAKNLEMKDTDFSFANAKTILDDSSQRVQTISSQCRLDFSGYEMPTTIEDVGKISSKLKNQLGKIRLSFAERNEIEQLGLDRSRLIQSQSSLIDIRDQYLQTTNALGQKKEELTQTTQQIGSIEDIDREMARITIEVRNLMLKKEKNSKYNVIKNDSVEYMKTFGESVCPICGSSIDKNEVISRLESAVEKDVRDELNSIESQIATLKQSEDELSQISHKTAKYADEIKTLEHSLDDTNQRLSKLGVEIKEKADLPLFIDDEIKKIESGIKITDDKINDFSVLITTKEQQIQDIETNIEKAKTIQKIIEAQDEIKKLKDAASTDTKETQIVNREIELLEKFKNELTDVCDAITQVQNNRAKVMIDKSLLNINEFYNTLCSHPRYDNIQINVEPINIHGYSKNSYTIKASNSREKKHALISSRFSTGQMNCVALAIYLGLSRTVSYDLNFLILDDPSQNLGSKQKKALSGILKDLSKELQIIVATQDVELQDIIESQWASIYRRVYRCDFASDGTTRIECTPK